MSTKPARHTPSPSPSLSTNHSTSKFSKFLQKRGNRDGSKSVSAGTPSSLAGGSSSAAFPSQELSQSHHAVDVDEAPVIIEPVPIPRPRTRSERPVSSAPDSLHSSSQLYSSTSSTSRIGDLPTRLSGWFSHTFSSSSTDIPSLLAYHSSPKGKGPSALLTVAKHGKGHLDKAMRYLLDSDATPDKCTDPIWLLGVQHPGYEPPLPALPDVVATSPPSNINNTNSGTFRRSSASPTSFRSSISSVASSELSQSTNSSSSKIPNPAANWPPVFYIDFTSRIWLTYRSQFPVPIKDGRLADLCDSGSSGGGSGSVLGEGASAASNTTIVKSRPWNWVGAGGEKTWTSDSGWGCMLRTGQSLLANALIHMHLGRGLFPSCQIFSWLIVTIDWRRPPYPVPTADYATYVQILTWFLDTPVQEAPFSVHRMALAGKELGTDVGQWFGPSVAAGAIKCIFSLSLSPCF